MKTINNILQGHTKNSKLLYEKHVDSNVVHKIYIETMANDDAAPPLMFLNTVIAKMIKKTKYETNKKTQK